MTKVKNTKVSKFNIVLYLIVLVCVFSMFLATSYAYYKKVIDNKDNKDVNVKYVNIFTTFLNGDQINGYNIKPGWEESKEFIVENFSDDAIGKYKIYFEIITPLSNMSDEDFVYNIEGISESKDTSNEVINKNETPIPVLSKDIGSATITPNNSHSYKVTMKIKDTADATKYTSGNLFAVKIKIVNDLAR